ncbi:MAG TPA: C40 family peptidase [Bacilli bacterium]|nr:C40 family peptidase [Bacilli bacterium]
MQRWKKGLLLGIFSSMLWEQDAVEAAVSWNGANLQATRPTYEMETATMTLYGPPLAVAEKPLSLIDPLTLAPRTNDERAPATRLRMDQLGVQKVKRISPAPDEGQQRVVVASRSGAGNWQEQREQAVEKAQAIERRESSNPQPTLMQGSGATAPVMGQAVTVALRYQGSPYVYGGTSPGGFDCSGFVQYVLRQVGVEVPRTTWGQLAAGTQVSQAQLQPGDIVFFLGNSHSGLYIGNGQFIHADQNSGITVDDLSSGYWAGVFQVGVRIRR